MDDVFWRCLNEACWNVGFVVFVFLVLCAGVGSNWDGKK